MEETDSEKPLATKSTILSDSLDVGNEFKKRFNDGRVGRDPITIILIPVYYVPIA